MRPVTRSETIHLINGSGSGMFLHFEEKNIYIFFDTLKYYLV